MNVDKNHDEAARAERHFLPGLPAKALPLLKRAGLFTRDETQALGTGGVVPIIEAFDKKIEDHVFLRSLPSQDLEKLLAGSQNFAKLLHANTSGSTKEQWFRLEQDLRDAIEPHIAERKLQEVCLRALSTLPPALAQLQSKTAAADTNRYQADVFQDTMAKFERELTFSYFLSPNRMDAATAQKCRKVIDQIRKAPRQIDGFSWATAEIKEQLNNAYGGYAERADALLEKRIDQLPEERKKGKQAAYRTDISLPQASTSSPVSAPSSKSGFFYAIKDNQTAFWEHTSDQPLPSKSELPQDPASKLSLDELLKKLPSDADWTPEKHGNMKKRVCDLHSERIGESLVEATVEEDLQGKIEKITWAKWPALKRGR